MTVQDVPALERARTTDAASEFALYSSPGFPPARQSQAAPALREVRPLSAQRLGDPPRSNVAGAFHAALCKPDGLC